MNIKKLKNEENFYVQKISQEMFLKIAQSNFVKSHKKTSDTLVTHFVQGNLIGLTSNLCDRRSILRHSKMKIYYMMIYKKRTIRKAILN